MAKLDARLAKLEAAAGNSVIGQSRIAVMSVPLPDLPDYCDWVERLLLEQGWTGERFGLWIVDGPPDVRLRITRIDDLSPEQEAVWLEAGGSYPRVLAMADTFVVAVREESEAHAREQWQKIEREIWQ